jgi:hypothetical protein
VHAKYAVHNELLIADCMVSRIAILAAYGVAACFLHYNFVLDYHTDSPYKYRHCSYTDHIHCAIVPCIIARRYLREMVVVQAQAEGATSALSGCRVVVTELSLHVPRGIKLRLTDLDITVLKGVVSSSGTYY